MMWIRKNKKYIAIILGGTPYHLDVALDLCAEPEPFYIIHGFNTFVVLFNSKKSLKSIRSSFVRLLSRDVNMLFVFQDNNLIKYKDGSNFIFPELITPLLKISKEEKYDNQMYGLRVLLNSYGMINKNNFQDAHGELNNGIEELSDQEKLGLLLDKMKMSGYNSLTPEELEFLRKYKNDNLNKSE